MNLPKLSLILSVIVGLISSAGVAQAQGSTWEPKSYGIERYEKSWERNPFNLKTAVAEKPKADFAKDLVVAGVATLGKKRRIWLQNIRTKEYIRVGDEVENDAGIELVELHKDPDPTKVIVRVTNGSLEAEVKYDASSLGGKGSGGTGGGANRNAPQPAAKSGTSQRRILLPGQGRTAQRIKLPSQKPSEDEAKAGGNTGPSNVKPTSGAASERRDRTVPESRED